MTAEQQLPEEPPARRRRWLRVALIVGVLLAVAFAALWISRKPLADSYIASELTKYGVQARYRITELGFSTQRIEDVVIGDPADPDLRADWVEVKTYVGLTGASVTGIRVGKVWMRARLKDGQVSFGQLDKLLPEPSGEPLALPELNAEIGDAQIRFETPQGLMMLRMAGKGRLDDGFAGRFGAQSARLALGDCTAERIDAALAIRISERKPRLTGPARLGALDCGTTRVEGASAELDLGLSEAFDKWDGRAGLAVARLTAPDVLIERISGPVTFAGDAKQTGGKVEIATGGFALGDNAGARLGLSGRYSVGAFSGFDGTASVGRLALPAATLAQLRKAGEGAAGTPAGPLIAQLTDAAARAGQAVDAQATITVRTRGEGGDVLLREAGFETASGARGTLSGEGLVYRWPAGTVQVNGSLSLAGGGLPDARLALSQASPGGPVSGTATIAPYSAGNARLELAPVRFTAAPGGATQFATHAVLSGPLGDDGRIEGASLPLEGQWDGGSRLLLNPRCGVFGIERLKVASLVLDRSRLGLCPVGGAWVVFGPRGLEGGARTQNVHLGGTLGESRIQLEAAALELRLGRTGFTFEKLAIALPHPDGTTRLDLARLEGDAAGDAVAGSFSGGSGQIRNVPLKLSDAEGTWRFADGTLRLENKLMVSDTVDPARFVPVASDDVVLSLSDNRIDLTGTLQVPSRGIKLADVAIGHDLSTGAGQADLEVHDLTFVPEGFQPSDLTPVTKGVIAAVDGTLGGHGTIRWNAAGEVTSTGSLRVKNFDLAAAFGPVTKLNTEIQFSDLLGLVTPPGQVATISTLNPGLPVENGVVRYQLLGEQRVAIEEARWPFAGGVLSLEPTMLDFASTGEKKLVFRVTGASAAQFLQQAQFENLNATGTFDGVLPILFDQSGGRIEGGELLARPGGGTIAYIGAVSEENLGFWGNMAFDALKSLRYRELHLQMDGPLTGEMITQIRFAGVEQGEGTRTNFVVKQLIHLPLVFNVTIRAPFRQLIDSVQSYYDPNRLIELNLPALIEHQSRETGETIQAPESETVP